ncbi:uncharacterized protein MONBRDRAFT_25965 [Monosiga brevicollis MX1]|uniref:Uncharacterized protein n=1 Tax=Monosiga brevicollis TaxID=81824 RepID=A9V0Z6_MONBE|nr:uncharacterized protein MONBRDRAFT_25965 [Monosiga brevicollis MX1]EDQ88719.1 predicted protein [Monosiga brevicollis MX1]|eukprot:XP_001746332.1 hypothetical protein [Monosiga brevicollis MX1]
MAEPMRKLVHSGDARDVLTVQQEILGELEQERSDIEAQLSSARARYQHQQIALVQHTHTLKEAHIALMGLFQRLRPSPLYYVDSLPLINHEFNSVVRDALQAQHPDAYSQARKRALEREARRDAEHEATQEA